MHSAFDSLTIHFVSFYTCMKVFVMVRLDTCMPFPYSIGDFYGGEVLTSRYILVWEGWKGMWLVVWPGL